jgi:hypothetical protein
MEFRFRYLGPEGGEVEVSSLEELRQLVHEGAVSEVTVLYDSLTREWAPARSHAVYRFIRDEAARPEGPLPSAPPPASKEEGRAAPAPADDMGLGITLSLEEAPSAPDADEAVRALLKERARDNDPPVRSDVMKVSWTAPVPKAEVPQAEPEPMAPEAQTPAMAAWAAPEAAPEPVIAAAPAAPRPGLVSHTPIPKIAPHPPRPIEPIERPIFRTEAPPPAKPALSIEAAAASIYDALRVDRVTRWLDDLGQALIRSVGPRVLPRTLVLAGLLGLLFVLLTTIRRGDGTSVPPTAQVAAMSVAPDVGRLVNRFASAEESGFRTMVAGVDSLRDLHRIADVPRIWLEGAYLADAHRYPQVKDFWTRYQSFLRDVEGSDTALFRAGFVKSLEAQGIGGAVLSLRLSQAMREFEKSQERRDDVYAHMEELSSAALELHALLVARADDISYEPALQRGVSREPVVEAMAEDTLLKDHMWTLLERIFASLEWVGGDLGGSRDNVTDLLLQGIEASAR